MVSSVQHIRSKGHGGEREVARYLETVLDELGIGIPIQRALGQARNGGADIVDVPGLVFEVKRQERLNVPVWWRQVTMAADRQGDIPVLAYRQNRRSWQYCLPAGLLVVGITGYITLDHATFDQWFRHYAIDMDSRQDGATSATTAITGGDPLLG